MQLSYLQTRRWRNKMEQKVVVAKWIEIAKIDRECERLAKEKLELRLEIGGK